MKNLKIVIFLSISLQIAEPLSNSNQASKNCAINKVKKLYDYLGKDIFYKQEIGLKCDIKNSDFTLDNVNYMAIENKINEYQKNKKLAYIEFNWPSKKTESSSLTKKFNLTSFMRLFSIIYFHPWVYFHNLHRIELNLFDEPTALISEMFVINSDLRFTIDGKTVKTCADITSAHNGTFKISSLFQIPLVKNQKFFLFGCRFPLTLCPLAFNRFSIIVFGVFDLVDTFYKRNLLKFSNDTFDDLNTNITSIHIYHSENLALDTSLFNPYVFKNLKYIYFLCSVSSISKDLFTSLKNVFRISFETVYFRKIIHRNGIEWIKEINRGLHVNLSNLTDFRKHRVAKKFIFFETLKGIHIEPMSRVFPDEDFCIYKDYPFEQLIFSFQYCYDCFSLGSFEYLKRLNPSYSCTYLWITQYFHLLKYAFSAESVPIANVYFLINSESYKKIDSCDFQKRIAICNRSDYHLKDIWGQEDFIILNKIFQIVVKILTYLVSLFSITTNMLVIRIIYAKHNKHVFKDFKHYTYLSLISIFSLSISFIEIVSWLSECFYPFEVFCLGVHKTIVAQLFKMVVKECLVITLRFLSNFCYIAFALCRIALIGRDHNKLIKFMSKLTIWKYVLCSLVLSLAFSWIKYFKYSINFGLGELNYPIWNERDIATPSASLPLIMDFYMVFNVISDLLNYLVFFVVCFVVDLGMLIKLRSTVNESLERIKSMISEEKQSEKKKSEMEETMKKSIRMVVFNTSIGLLFKIPLVFLPLSNTIAKFYYKDTKTRYNNLVFDRFYSFLLDADFYPLIQDSTEFLYLISISIQFFIYKTFDKKFKEGTIFSLQTDTNSSFKKSSFPSFKQII